MVTLSTVTYYPIPFRLLNTIVLSIKLMTVDSIYSSYLKLAHTLKISKYKYIGHYKLQYLLQLIHLLITILKKLAILSNSFLTSVLRRVL